MLMCGMRNTFEVYDKNGANQGEEADHDWYSEVDLTIVRSIKCIGGNISKLQRTVR